MITLTNDEEIINQLVSEYRQNTTDYLLRPVYAYVTHPRQLTLVQKVIDNFTFDTWKLLWENNARADVTYRIDSRKFIFRFDLEMFDVPKYKYDNNFGNFSSRTALIITIDKKRILHKTFNGFKLTRTRDIEIRNLDFFLTIQYLNGLLYLFTGAWTQFLAIPIFLKLITTYNLERK